MSDAITLLREIRDELRGLRLDLASQPQRPRRRSAAAVRDKGLIHQGRAESAPHALDPCLVALAEIEGSDCAALTASALAGLEQALREIRAINKTVTPQEILARAARYKARWRDWTLTARALAKHWSQLAAAPAPAKRVVPPEPADWVRRFLVEYAVNGWTPAAGPPQGVQRESRDGWTILRWPDLGNVNGTSLWSELLDNGATRAGS